MHSSMHWIHAPPNHPSIITGCAPRDLLGSTRIAPLQQPVLAILVLTVLR